MAVLFASNSLIHWGGNPVKETISGRFDSSKVDYGMRVNDFSSIGMAYPHEAPSGDTVYYQWNAHITGSGGSSEDGYMMGIYDITGNLLFRIELLNNIMYAQVFGDTTVATSSGSSMGSVNIQDFKVRLTVNPTEITGELFVSGVSIATATAANTGGKTVGRSLAFDMSDAMVTSFLSFSNVVISDTDLHNFGFTKLNPISAGTDTDFFGDVADITDDDDTTGIIGDAVNEKSSFNMETYNNGSVVHEYMVTAVLSAGAGAPGNFRFYLLIGGVRYYGATQAIGAETTILAKESWSVDPSDSLAWTQAKINAAQVGVEIL